MAELIQEQSVDTLGGILESVNIPSAPDLNAGTTTIPGQGTTSSPAPTTPSELDSFLADWQKKQSAASQTWEGYFESDTGKTAQQNIIGQVMPEELPKPPSLVDAFKDMRQEFGLDSLEQSLNDLKAQEREQQAIRRERIGNTYDERSRMSAIQGQVSEIERQEMERLDFLGREIQYRVDLVNSAYNIINLTTNLMNMDWQNAKEWWTTKFNANMAVYQQLRSEFESDRSYAQQQLEYQQTVAKSNLQIYIDMISNGQMFYDKLDQATKTEITKLEIQSGLGKGFLSTIKMDPDKQIKSITTRVAGTTKYADILRIDPKTGKVSVQTVKLGSEYSYSGGGGSSSSTKTKAAEQLAADRAGIVSNLSKVVGKDGKVSPESWRRARNEWLGLGYSAQQFNQYFGQYVDRKSTRLNSSH